MHDNKARILFFRSVVLLLWRSVVTDWKKEWQKYITWCKWISLYSSEVLSLYGVGTTEQDYTKQPQYMLFIQLKYTLMKNDLNEMHEPKNIK